MNLAIPFPFGGSTTAGTATPLIQNLGQGFGTALDAALASGGSNVAIAIASPATAADATAPAPESFSLSGGVLTIGLQATPADAAPKIDAPWSGSIVQTPAPRPASLAPAANDVAQPQPLLTGRFNPLPPLAVTATSAEPLPAPTPSDAALVATLGAAIAPVQPTPAQPAAQPVATLPAVVEAAPAVAVEAEVSEAPGGIVQPEAAPIAPAAPAASTNTAPVAAPQPASPRSAPRAIDTGAEPAPSAEAAPASPLPAPVKNDAAPAPVAKPAAEAIELPPVADEAMPEASVADAAVLASVAVAQAQPQPAAPQPLTSDRPAAGSRDKVQASATPAATATPERTAALEPRTVEARREQADAGSGDKPALDFELPAQAPAEAAASPASPRAPDVQQPAAPRSAAPADPASATASAPAAAPDTPVVNARPGEIGRGMGVEIARRVNDGNESLIVKLNPDQLGKVEVAIAFDDGGSLRATVRAESQVALDMLRRDLGELNRTLDQAGIRADAQSFRFESRADGQASQQQGQRDAHRPAGRADFGLAGPADAATDLPYRPVRGSGQVDLLA